MSLLFIKDVVIVEGAFCFLFPYLEPIYTSLWLPEVSSSFFCQISSQYPWKPTLEVHIFQGIFWTDPTILQTLNSLVGFTFDFIRLIDSFNLSVNHKFRHLTYITEQNKRVFSSNDSHFEKDIVADSVNLARPWHRVIGQMPA